MKERTNVLENKSKTKMQKLDDRCVCGSKKKCKSKYSNNIEQIIYLLVAKLVEVGVAIERL